MFVFFYNDYMNTELKTVSDRGGLNDSGEAAQGLERATDYRNLCLRRSGQTFYERPNFLLLTSHWFYCLTCCLFFPMRKELLTINYLITLL